VALTASVTTDGKPTQRNPSKGEILEGLPGLRELSRTVHEERGMREEKHQGPFGKLRAGFGRS